MAGNAVIGALRVVLGADTAALEKGLKDARGSLAAFGQTAGTALAAAGVALSAAAVGLGAAIKSSINQADELSKMAQKIGVPIEQLSALKYAADLSGVSLEALQKGLGKLARSVLDAAQGSTTAVAAYQALAISFRDSNGQLKSVGDLLPQIADRFASMKDGTVKTALAMQIFGKAGADLIPLLNLGASGLKELTDEARALGIVIDGQTGRAAEAFNDNLKRLHMAFNGIVTQVTAQMLPAFLRFSQIMVDAAKNSDLMKQTADGLVGVLRFVVTETIKASVTFQRAAADLTAFWKVLTAPNWEAMKNAWAEFGKSRDETAKALDGLGATVQKFYTDAAAGAPKAASAIAGTFNPNIIKTTKDALDSFIASKQKEIATFQAAAATMGQSNIIQERAKIVAEGLAIATANHIPVTEALRAKLQQLAETWSTWNEKAVFGKQVFEQTRTPAEQFAATMERLNIAFENGQRDSDTYARAVAQAQDKLVQANPAAQILGQSLETAFGRAMEKGAQLGTVLRSLLQDLAKASASALFKRLLYGDASQGGTSSGLLGGLFSFLPKFASGGTIMPGGSGGIDSQLVQFYKSPTERVDITNPGQSVGGGSGGAVINQYFNNTFSGMTGSDRQWSESRMIQVAAQAKQAAITEIRSTAARKG